MHHGTCVMHMLWCMSGLLTLETVLGIPSACATHNFVYLVRGPCNGQIADRMLMLRQGNDFHITGSLCGESTCLQWIPHTMGKWCEPLWVSRAERNGDNFVSVSICKDVTAMQTTVVYLPVGEREIRFVAGGSLYWKDWGKVLVLSGI